MQHGFAPKVNLAPKFCQKLPLKRKAKFKEIVRQFGLNEIQRLNQPIAVWDNKTAIVISPARTADIGILALIIPDSMALRKYIKA